MESLFLGINILVAYLFWKRVWYKTVLDRQRDCLFDLRDEVKNFFIVNNYGLNHAIYNELRSLINGHIRYTESLTFSSFVAKTIALQSNPDTVNQLREIVNKRFETSDQIISDFVKSVRTRAIGILNVHMTETSFIFLTLAILIIPIFLVKKMFSVFAENALKDLLYKKPIFVFKQPLRYASIGVCGLMLALPIRYGYLSKAFGADVVEEYSYQASVLSEQNAQ